MKAKSNTGKKNSKKQQISSELAVFISGPWAAHKFYPKSTSDRNCFHVRLASDMDAKGKYEYIIFDETKALDTATKISTDWGVPLVNCM